jgi:uncharacterized membrane protein YgdD (TMEM256/DUF423 family)
MYRKFLITGFSFAALSVIIGAFAAHGLEDNLKTGLMTEKDLKVFDTGARYQMYHAFAIIICGILAKLFGENKLLKVSGILFISGIIFFSGSLYLLSTAKILGIENWKWLGPITPIGGLCFITAWILLAVSFLKNKTPN